MKRIVPLFVLLLTSCPHPSAPNGVVDSGVVEVGPNDCNIDSGMLPEVPRPEVHFSPKGGCQEALVERIRKSKRTVHVQAYTLTAKPVIDALVVAHGNGVDVQVVIDSSETKVASSPLPLLRAGGVPVFIDSKHLIAHNKVMLFDGELVETGSYNYTNAAENDNAENCLFVNDKALTASYEENWRAHQGHSTAAP